MVPFIEFLGNSICFETGGGFVTWGMFGSVPDSVEIIVEIFTSIAATPVVPDPIRFAISISIPKAVATIPLHLPTAWQLHGGW